jgi:hypothetical protein
VAVVQYTFTPNSTQNTKNGKYITVKKMVRCGPSYTLAFAVQLRNKHGKPSVRVKKTSG